MLDALTFHRLAHRLHVGGHPTLARVIGRAARHLFSTHIDPGATIGPRCELGYGGFGVVVHGAAVIGADVLLSTGVVIGGRSELPGAPVIEDGVKIGAGAKILGPIRLGAGAKVGANAVVVHDVPAGVTVAGVPARPITSRSSSRIQAA